MEDAIAVPRLPMASWRQALRFSRDPFALLSEARARCGDVFQLDVAGLGRWIMLCSPEAAEAMFRAPAEELSAGQANHRFLGFLLGDDAHTNVDGEPQRRRRRLSQGHFLERRALGHTAMIRRVTAARVASWPIGEPVRLLDEAKELSVEVLVRAVFGTLEEAPRRELCRRIRGFFTRGPGSPAIALPFLRRDVGPWSPWGRVRRDREAMRAAMREVIAARRREPADDVVSALVAAEMDPSTPAGPPLGDEAICDELTNILFAGTETTARILAWAAYGVLAHEEVGRRLTTELATVVGERPIAAEDLGELAYLTAVIHEAIRRWPLGPFTGARVVRRPCTLFGFRLEPGALVAHCHAEICRRTDLFERPDAFHPDHFLGERLTTRQWRPFGGGNRMCLGMALALVELRTALATLFQAVELELLAAEIRPRRGSFLFEPEKGLPVRVVRRRGAFLEVTAVR